MSRYIIETEATDEEIARLLQDAGYLPLIRYLPALPTGENLTDAQRLERIAVWIDTFDQLTSDNEYTDVGDAWDLFNDIRNLARGQL